MFLTEVVRGNILAHRNAPETFAQMQTPTLWGLDVKNQIIVRYDRGDRSKKHGVGGGDKKKDHGGVGVVRRRGPGRPQGFDRA